MSYKRKKIPFKAFYLIIAAFLLLVSTAAAAPTADFTANQTSGTAPLTVSFTDHSTGGANGWAWFFGDENYTEPWTEVTGSAGWSACDSPAAAALPNGHILVIGGDHWGNPLNETWRSTDGGETWTNVTDSANWTGREGSAAVALPDGSVVLIGGMDNTWKNLNDTWRSTDEGATWTEMNDSAGWTAREGSAAVALPDGSVLVMGGDYGYPQIYLNDTWRSTDKGATWTEVNANSGWSGRYNPAAVALPDGSVIIMGGYDGSNYLNDTWRSTDGGETWTEMNGSAPWTARASMAAAALPDGSVIIMGGYYSVSYDPINLNDVWRSTDGGTTWEQLPEASWEARRNHAAAALTDGSVIVMGGTEGTNMPVNDVWRFQPAGSNTENPTHTYESAGTYTVTLQAYNDDGATRANTTITVTPPVAPTASFTADPTSGTAPLTVAFNDTSVGEPTNWTWDFGDCGSAITPNTTHLYTHAGTYTVTLTVENTAGTNASSRQIQVAVPVPTASFTADPTSGTAPLAVSFTDHSTGGATNWTWFFGDENYTEAWTKVNGSAGWSACDSPAAAALPNGHILVMGGDHRGYPLNETWRSTDGGTTWELMNASSGWSVRENLAAVTLSDGSVLIMGGRDGSGNPLNDTWRSTDEGTTWTEMNDSAGWTGREGSAAVALSDGSVLVMGGEYGYHPQINLNDTWRSTDKGATWTEVNASSGWTARYGHAAAALTDGSVIVMGGRDGSGNYLNDTWRSTDGGETWTEMNGSAPWTARYCPAAAALTDGSVIVMGGTEDVWNEIDLNDTWRSTDGGTTWEQLPDADWWVRYSQAAFTLPDGSVIVMGGMVTSTCQMNDVWRFQPAGSNTENPTHTYESAGTYTVTLQAYNDDGATRANTTITVTVLVAPTAAFNATPTDGNAPLTVNFTDNSVGDPTSWSWNFGDGTNSTGQNQTHTYTVPGTYTVSLNASNAHGFNVSTVTDAVRVLPAPVAGFTFTPTDGNAPLTVNFSDNSTGNVTAWTWNFGDGTNSTGQNPNHTYAVPGTYTVSLNASNVYGFNVSTVTDAVAALAPPVAGFTFTPTDGNAPLTVNFTDNSTGNVTAWLWNFGDGTTSIEQNPNHTYTVPGTYTVSLNASNAYAFNVSTIAEAVRVLPAPVAGFTFTPTEGNAPLTVNFSDNSTGNVTARLWDFGDGTNSTEQNPNHTYAVPGTYTVSLNASNTYGFNVSTITDAVAALAPPVAGFTFTPTDGNAPLNVTFSDNSTGNVTAWAWNFGDGTTSIEQNPNHTYTVPGTYTVSLNASNAYAFNVSTVTDAVHVLPTPVAGFTFTPTDGNAPLNVTFTDNSTGNVTAWAWNFGDGTTSIEQNATHTYAVPGTYTVSLNASNVYGFNVSTIADAVVALAPPVAGFTFTPTDGNAPLNVTFNDTSSGNVTAWAWNFGDGTNSTEQNPIHTYASAGTYNVSLNASNAYGSNVSTITDAVRVLPAPVAGFTLTPTEGNAPLNVTFSDNSTGNGTAWAWNFGDGTNSTEQNPIHTYASAGTYTVSLNASNAYGFNVSTVSDAVHVIPAPIADFTFSPGEGNAPLAVNFTDTSAGNVATWLWNFGDGNVSSEQNPAHRYEVPGTYTVSLNASNAYGFNISTVSDAIHVLPAPVAGFILIPTEGNAPLNVTFSDTSAGNITARLWDFGDGNTSIEQNPNHTYASAGTYTVSLNASNAHGFNVSTITDAVRVLPAPVAGFTLTPTDGNAPLTVNFTDNSTGNVTAWLWDFGDGNTSTEQNPNHTYASAGTYNVSLNASNVYGFNVSTIADAVRVLPAPVAGFTLTPTEGNAPLNVTFSDNSTGNVTAWLWNFGDGNTSTEQNPNHTYASAGTYNVSLNASNTYGFNVSTVSDAVVALAPPVAGFTFTPTEGNAPLTVNFTDNSTGNVTVRLWNFGDGTNSTEQNPNHIYASAGTYTVSLNASNTYGLNVSTANITVSSPSSHSGSSSGGSSDLAAKSASNIPAGGDASLTFSGQAIYGIGVTAGESIPNLLVTIGESSLPSNVTAPAETVYEYDEVTLYHTTDDAVESASLLFTVPKTWLEENNLDPADVVLYRYHDGEWQALPTEAVSEDTTSWHFSAKSPGFCLFAIGGDRTPVAVETTSAGAQAGTTETTQPVTAVETTSPTVETQQSFPTMMVLLICGAAVLLIIAVVVRRRQTEQQEEDLFKDDDEIFGKQ